MGATAHRLVKGDRTLRIPLTTSISSDIVGWAKASSLSHVQSVSVLPFRDNWCSGVRAPLITAAVFTYPAIKPFRREVHTVMIVQLYDYFVKRICRWHMQPTWALYSIMTSYLDHRPRRIMHVSCQPGMPPPRLCGSTSYVSHTNLSDQGLSITVDTYSPFNVLGLSQGKILPISRRYGDVSQLFIFSQPRGQTIIREALRSLRFAVKKVVSQHKS